MKEVRIREEKDLEEGRIQVSYNGFARDDIDLERIHHLLDNFLSYHTHHDMVENVRIARTILEKCNESSLVINYKNDSLEEMVRYGLKDLVVYHRNNVVEIEKEDGDVLRLQSQFQYDFTEGINLICHPSGLELKNYSCVRNVISEFDCAMHELYLLKKIKASLLEFDDDVLIELYRLFYHKNPDFMHPDIHFEIQTMVSILNEFGIYLHENYEFILGKEGYPVSLKLKKRVDWLYPFGEVENFNGTVDFTEDVRKVIEIIGEALEEAISDKPDKIKELMAISKFLYAERYGKEINEFGLNQNDVNLKLVRKISNRIEKEVD